jgi:hypothetical protein
MDTDDAVTTIAQTLGETEPEPLQRLRAVVDILGPEQALALCENALAVEQQGGMLTQDGTRRRTVGGIFQIPSDLVVDQWVSNVESSSPRDVL